MDWLCQHQDLQTKLMGWGMGLIGGYLLLSQLFPGWLAGIIDFLKG